MERALLLLLLFSATNRDNSTRVMAVNDYINNMEIDTQYTREKIRLAKRIAPLMPKDYIRPMSRSIYITETIVRLMELRDFMALKPVEVSVAASEESEETEIDNRERLNRIVSIIQEEMPKSKAQNMGSLLELIVNMDKYRRMFEIFNTLRTNQNMTTTDNLTKTLEPVVKNGAKGGDNSMDLEKIINIINILNKTKERPEGNKVNVKEELSDSVRRKRAEDENMEEETKEKESFPSGQDKVINIAHKEDLADREAKKNEIVDENLIGDGGDLDEEKISRTESKNTEKEEAPKVIDLSRIEEEKPKKD